MTCTNKQGELVGVNGGDFCSRESLFLLEVNSSLDCIFYFPVGFCGLQVVPTWGVSTEESSRIKCSEKSSYKIMIMNANLCMQ